MKGKFLGSIFGHVKVKSSKGASLIIGHLFGVRKESGEGGSYAANEGKAAPWPWQGLFG